MIHRKIQLGARQGACGKSGSIASGRVQYRATA
jgi:hypothetical protein